MGDQHPAQSGSSWAHPGDRKRTFSMLEAQDLSAAAESVQPAQQDGVSLQGGQSGTAGQEGPLSSGALVPDCAPPSLADILRMEAEAQPDVHSCTMHHTPKSRPRPSTFNLISHSLLSAASATQLEGLFSYGLKPQLQQVSRDVAHEENEDEDALMGTPRHLLPAQHDATEPRPGPIQLNQQRTSNASCAMDSQPFSWVAAPASDLAQQQAQQLEVLKSQNSQLQLQLERAREVAAARQEQVAAQQQDMLQLMQRNGELQQTCEELRRRADDERLKQLETELERLTDEVEELRGTVSVQQDENAQLCAQLDAALHKDQKQRTQLDHLETRSTYLKQQLRTQHRMIEHLSEQVRELEARNGYMGARRGPDPPAHIPLTLDFNDAALAVATPDEGAA